MSNRRNASVKSVFVVVDPDFSEKLRAIPVGRPVWITMSPANEPIVRSLWEGQKSTNHLTGITGFRFDREISAEDRFREELDTIDLHHGPHSSTSPYTEIEVMGCAPHRRDPR
ncbi:MAG TPA: hypothetical protein VHY35_25455 [Stellaceae bacterium]|jgi:hypothetical protein|nr:hypothetical protein [Stellaceae bacterium]